jgi:outer membrane lipoprotein
MNTMTERGLGCCLALALLAGCASVPETITTPVPGPDVREVRANPQPHIGKTVRWGGTIGEVQNLEDGTVITVVARRLSSRGEPSSEEKSIGRFLADVNRFLEPEEYSRGRRITVVGRIAGMRQEKIDQYVYSYPVVQVRDLYLWEEYTRRDRYPHYCPPFWRYPYSWHERYFHYPYSPWCY